MIGALGRVAAVAALLLSAAAQAQEIDCAAAFDQGRAASGDVAALSDLHRRAEASCAGPVVASVADLLGRAHYARAGAAGKAGDAATAKAELGLATRYLGALRWRAHASLGALLQQDGAFEAAAEQYQLALVRLDEQGPGAADEATVRRLLARANETRALAPRYTRAVRTRSNAPGGVAARSIAGVQIEAVPFPVEFAFNSAEIAADGAFAVQDMFEILRDSGATAVTLVGHTDPVGSDIYNQSLSLRRAQSVRDALVALGARYAIDVVGAGEREPPVFDDPTLYTESQRHQIMRRVVLERAQ